MPVAAPMIAQAPRIPVDVVSPVPPAKLMFPVLFVNSTVPPVERLNVPVKLSPPVPLVTIVCCPLEIASGMLNVSVFDELLVMFPPVTAPAPASAALSSVSVVVPAHVYDAAPE